MPDLFPISRHGATLTTDDQEFLLDTLRDLEGSFDQAVLKGLIQAHCRCTGLAAGALTATLLQRLCARGLVKSEGGTYRAVTI